MGDGAAAVGVDENQALAEQATADTSMETGHIELKEEAQSVEGTSAKTNKEEEEEERARAKRRKAKGKEKVDPSYTGKNESRDKATLNPDGKKKKPKKKKKVSARLYVPPYWQKTTHRYPRSEPKRKILGPNWPKWDAMVQVRFRFSSSKILISSGSLSFASENL